MGYVAPEIINPLKGKSAAFYSQLPQEDVETILFYLFNDPASELQQWYTVEPYVTQTPMTTELFDQIHQYYSALVNAWLSFFDVKRPFQEMDAAQAQYNIAATAHQTYLTEQADFIKQAEPAIESLMTIPAPETQADYDAFIDAWNEVVTKYGDVLTVYQVEQLDALKADYMATWDANNLITATQTALIEAEIDTLDAWPPAGTQADFDAFSTKYNQVLDDYGHILTSEQIEIITAIGNAYLAEWQTTQATGVVPSTGDTTGDTSGDSTGDTTGDTSGSTDTTDDTRDADSTTGDTSDTSSTTGDTSDTTDDQDSTETNKSALLIIGGALLLGTAYALGVFE